MLKFRIRQAGVWTEAKKRETTTKLNIWRPPRNPGGLGRPLNSPEKASKGPGSICQTPDQSQADKEGSGNLGREPETRKGIKLGGCLRKQGVGKRNQHTSSWFVGHERCAVARHAAPSHPGCVGAPFLHVTFSRRAARHPKP